MKKMKRSEVIFCHGLGWGSLTCLPFTDRETKWNIIIAASDPKPIQTDSTGMK